MINFEKIEKLAKLIRYYSLVSTTEAGSGHPTSSLSAADLMTVLMFGGFFKFDLDNPGFENNDRLIFSKGHASPLLKISLSLFSNPGLSKSNLKNPPNISTVIKSAADKDDVGCPLPASVV